MCATQIGRTCKINYINDNTCVFYDIDTRQLVLPFLLPLNDASNFGLHKMNKFSVAKKANLGIN